MKEIILKCGSSFLIDDDDFSKISIFNWSLHLVKGRPYVRTQIQKNYKVSYIYLHRFLISASRGVDVDHIDGNGLNNQKNNLRLASRSQNSANSIKKEGSSQYKGVHWFKRHNKWTAQITFNYKCFHLGYFEKEEDAAIAYDIKAKEFFGEFAKLNFKEFNHDKVSSNHSLIENR